jgi:hypothetical protein
VFQPAPSLPETYWLGRLSNTETGEHDSNPGPLLGSGLLDVHELLLAVARQLRCVAKTPTELGQLPVSFSRRAASASSDASVPSASSAASAGAVVAEE